MHKFGILCRYLGTFMSNRITRTFAAILCSPLLWTSLTFAEPVATTASAPEINDAIRKVYPALVRIYVVMEQGADGRMRKNQGSGSGTIISPEGHVLTNHHVAGRGTRFVCTLSTREEVDATLVGTDALSDLAIIKLDLSTRRLKDQPLPVASFGDSDLLKTGDVVFAMGSPGGLSQSVTRGIVANTSLIAPRNMGGLSLDGETVGELVRWIGHDAVIFPGNSGGPLVNPAGEIIGVNEVGIASLGGAIPANLAKKIAAELIEKGSISRSWIGLEIQPLLRHMTEAKGALVSHVWKDSPAAKAGIQPGDLLTKYQGAEIADCRSGEDLPLFNAMVLSTKPDTEVTIEGMRDGKAQTWKLSTVLREPNEAKESAILEWGITCRDFTRVAALEKSRKSTDGVLVDSVKGGGPSSQSKPALVAGDVIIQANGKPVRNRVDLKEITSAFVKELKKPESMLVEFERGSQKLATVVKIGPAEDIVKPRLAEKAYLGAATQVLTDELSEAYGIPNKKGVRVTVIAPDSPAQKAGLLAGDILLKLDGRVINARRPEDAEVFPELILAFPVDATITLIGLRDGKEQTWSVPLSARPIDDSELREYSDEMFELTLRQLSTAEVDSAKANHHAQGGISVSKVEPSGWAALGGLAPGDVILSINDADTNDLDAVKKTLLSFRESKPRSAVFQVRRNARTMFLEIEPRW